MARAARPGRPPPPRTRLGPPGARPGDQAPAGRISPSCDRRNRSTPGPRRSPGRCVAPSPAAWSLRGESGHARHQPHRRIPCRDDGLAAATSTPTRNSAFEEVRTCRRRRREAARIRRATRCITGIAQDRRGRRDPRQRRDSGRAIGLRADMDALPIHGGDRRCPMPRTTPAKMHACGHDGHTTMLLGAAKYLAETRNFDGTVYVIFQPAEENLGRRRGHGEGRPVRALPDGARLRHAQLARRAGGHLPVARGPGHGRGREPGGHHHRQGRAWRACRTTATTRS